MEQKKLETIDAHHHLWRYNPQDYGWIDDSMKSLRRDFLPADLIREMTAAEVDGTVAVQARQTVEETRWLLDLAEDCAAIRGVVGWAPIAGEEFPGMMEEFEDSPKLKGLRHVIQDEKDENYILREDFNSGIRCLRGSGLVYDILIFARHLPQTIEFVDEHPEQVFVLDHIAKPMIREGLLEPWATQIARAAEHRNVSMKLSIGLDIIMRWRWSTDAVRRYSDHVLDLFSPDRVMAASNWPVILLGASYAETWNGITDLVAELSAEERRAVLGATAKRIYGL